MRLNQFLLACGVLGAPIFLLSLFVFGLMYPGYDHFNQTISALGHADSPVKTLVNIFVFNLFGIFLILFSIGVFRSPEMHTIGKISSVFFFVAGIVMFLVGIFYGDDVNATQTLRGAIHNKVSFYPFPIMTVGFLFFAFDVMANKKLWWLVFPIITVGPVALVLRYLSSQFPYPYYVGILQRMAIALPFLITTLIAMALYRVQVKKGLFLFSVAITMATIGAVGMYLNGDTSSQRTGIPYLCSDEKDCRDFCHNRRGGCQRACGKYSANPVCQELFGLK